MKEVKWHIVLVQRNHTSIWSKQVPLETMHFQFVLLYTASSSTRKYTWTRLSNSIAVMLNPCQTFGYSTDILWHQLQPNIWTLNTKIKQQRCKRKKAVSDIPTLVLVKISGSWTLDFVHFHMIGSLLAL